MGDSWVGGDIGGLHTMGAKFKSVKSELDDVVKPVNTQVDDLVKDSGWSGDAAKTFKGTWSRDSMTAAAFASFVGSVGKVLADLARDLQAAETALQNAEDVAVGKGVPMKAKGVPGDLVTNDPPSASEQKTVHALNGYNDVRKQALHDAQEARLKAAKALNKLYADATGGPGSELGTGDKLTLADYLAGLYRSDYNATKGKGKAALDRLDDAKAESTQAKKDWRAERKAWQKEGRTLPKDAASHTAYKDSLTKLDSLHGDIAAAEKGSTRLPYERELNYSLEDTAKAARVGEGFAKVPGVLRDIPVVDVAAAGACTVLSAKDDHDEGWSWKRSLAVNGAANAGGLAAGAGAGAAASAAVGAVVSSPVAGAVAAAGAGGFVAYVGVDAISNGFHEHWSEDIHDHGVVGGVLEGSGHVASETGGDVADLGKGIWHGVTSIF